MKYFKSLFYKSTQGQKCTLLKTATYSIYTKSWPFVISYSSVRETMRLRFGLTSYPNPINAYFFYEVKDQLAA